MHALNLLDLCHALCFEVIRQVAQREGMPLNRFRAMILAFVVENVFLNRNTNRTPRTRTCRGFFAHLRTSGGGLRMTLLFILFVRRHRKTSNSEAFTVRQVLRTSYQIFALCRRQVLTRACLQSFSLNAITACLL